MPDKKITDLVDGAPLQPTDEFVVARAGDNFKIDGAEVVAAVTKHDVTISGNTAGALAAISSGTWTLAGGNNITLSQAGNAVTISGAAAGGAQTFIGGISASDTLYTSGTVRITGVGGGVTVSSNTGQRVDISVAAQSVQPETQTFIAGISASDTLYTSGNVRFTGVGGGITVSSNTGQRVDLSVASQTVQTQGVLSAGVSTAGNTAGNTTVNTGSRFVLVASGNATASQATAAGASTVTISVGTQTVQTQDVLSVGVSTGGNTAGNTTVNTGSRFVIVGSNGITASQGTAAGATTVTLSGITQSAQTQGIINAGVSTGGNTSGDTTVNTGTRLVFVGSNNITLSQGTAANATTITISGPTVGGAQTGISGIANSQTTYTSGTVSLSELGAITIRSTTGNQFQFSVNSQTVQTQDVLSIGVSTGGNTAGNTTVNTGSRLVIVGSNGITASQGTAAGATTITLSGVTQSVQTNDIPRLGVSTGGNTAGDTTVNSGTRFVLVGTNMISLSQATAASATTISINATQSAQTQGIINAGVSNVGNTSGDTGVNSGTRLVFAGGNNITLSQGTAANATTVTISAGAGGGFSAGMSTQGNTAGDTGFASQRIALVGSNNITLSGSTNGGSMTISFNAPSPGAAQFSVGASNLGNTAGSTGVTGTRIVHVGSGALTMSQSTDATGATISHVAPATSSLSATGIVEISVNGSTISIGAGPTLSEWRNFGGVGTAAGGVGLTWVPVNASSRSLVVAPLGLNEPGRNFPGNMTVSSLYLGPWSQSDSTATMSAANTVSVSLGVYTLNGSTLSLLNSASTSWGNAASTNNSTSTVGVRWLSFHSSQWSSSPVFTHGHYWIATLFNTSGAQITRTQSLYGGSWVQTTAYSGTMGVATQNATTMGLEPFYGLYSATTTAMPAAISSNALNKQTAAAGFYPLILFNNINNSF